VLKGQLDGVGRQRVDVGQVRRRQVLVGEAQVHRLRQGQVDVGRVRHRWTVRADVHRWGLAS
jgi:hypothetical protein